MAQPRSVLAAAFEQQAQWCDDLGSPFNAALLRDLAADVMAQGLTAAIIGDWADDPIEGALPLRLTGALHALALAQDDEELTRVYPPQAQSYDKSTWRTVHRALERQRQFVAAFLRHAPQTNEVRRSAVLLGGFLTIHRRFGLPLRLREIGASAGLNLGWPDYRYEFGSWSWGRRDSALILTTDWRGPPPPLSETIGLLDRRGCDLHPIRLDDPADRRRLEAYVWPDQRDRLDRLRTAMAMAARRDIIVEQAPADEWLLRELAVSPAGTCTVLFHSVTWQYIAAAARDRIERTIALAAPRADTNRPLCHLRFEPQGDGYFLRLQTWPDGGDHLLAKADSHGRWVEWPDDEANLRRGAAAC